MHDGLERNGSILYVQSKSSILFFLDASKAFDRISHAKLFSKLIERNIPPVVIRFLINLYSHQYAFIYWNSLMSESFSILNGVKQGCISSPVLFCLYLDGLLICLRDARIGCFLGNTFVGALAYADDLTIIAPTADAARKMLDICDKYASQYSINFNADKSKCIFFRPGGRVVDYELPQFHIADKMIEYVKSWPHLGNVISDQQSDSECIQRRRIQLIGQINDVLCVFRKLDSVVKTDLLYKYCSSFYGSVLWNLQLPDINFICTAWRSALRKIWRIPYNTHSNTVSALGGKIPLLDELCRRVLNFHFVCLKSNNRIVSTMCRHSTVDDFSSSPHGRNLLFVCHRYGIDFHLLQSVDDRCSVIRSINSFCNDWLSKTVNPQFMTLLELLFIRDNALEFSSPSFLSDADIQFVIRELCSG